MVLEEIFKDPNSPDYLYSFGGGRVTTGLNFLSSLHFDFSMDCDSDGSKLVEEVDRVHLPEQRFMNYWMMVLRQIK